MRGTRAFWSILLGSALCCPIAAHAQKNPKPALGTPTPQNSVSQEQYPDQAFLSPTRYSNQYFGFALDFPQDAKLEAVSEPTPPDERIELLNMTGPAPTDAAVSLAAFPPLDRNSPDAKATLRRQLDRELYIGVEEIRGLSKTNISGHEFFLYQTKRGIEQHLAFATNLDGYVVIGILGANDSRVAKELEASFVHIKFFPRFAAAENAGPGAVEYEGPAISYHRMQALKSDPPATRIGAGKLEGNVYENDAVGFAYQFPKNWHVTPEGAIEPAVEKNRERVWGKPTLGAMEQQLVKNCSRTLLSVLKNWQEPGTPLVYDDFGEITVSAMANECFSAMKFPEKASDADAIRNFAQQYALTHPIVRDMRQARAYQVGDRLFIILQGMVAFQVQDDDLARRLSIALTLTEQNGYVLSWFFAAPHEADVRDLMNAKVFFKPDMVRRASSDAPKNAEVMAAASHRSSSSDAGGSNVSSPEAGNGASGASADNSSAAGSNAPVNSVPSDSTSSATSGGAQAAATGNNSESGADSSSTAASDGNQQQSSDASQRPSLLRPGETLEQPTGQPLPNKKR